MSAEPKIDTVGPEVAEMQQDAAVCQAVDGGVCEMRKKAAIYAPKRAKESQDDWKVRIHEAEFFPAFTHALDAYVGKPLGAPIVTQDVPAEIEPMLEDVDLQGHDLDSLARAVFRAGLRDGITWVVVDYPRVPQGLTLAQERALGARPYLIHVPLENVIDFHGEVVAGRHVCTHFRYRECVTRPAGRWGSVEVERIRVLEPGLVEVWEKRETAGGQAEWDLVPDESGPVTRQDIPVRAYAPGSEEWWEGEPPLEDLAWLNVTHWQSTSYQRNVLNVARVPLLTAEEDLRDDTQAAVTIGVSGMIVGFKGLAYVEHSGKSIEAGEKDLQKLEDQMRRVAGQILVTESGQKTATEAGLENREGGSKLRAWVWTFQDFLEGCLLDLAKWIGQDQGGSVQLNMDWDEDEVGADMLTALSNMEAKGQISRETLVFNVAKAKLLPPDTTPETELARLEMQGPPPLPVVPVPPQQTPQA